MATVSQHSHAMKKHIQTMNKALAIGACITFVSTAVQAESYYINLGTSFADPTSNLYHGAVPASGTAEWNDVNLSGSATLQDTTGAFTGAFLDNFNAPIFTQWSNTNSQDPLLEELMLINPEPDGAPFAIAGLNPGASFDVYYYVSDISEGYDPAQFDINGTPATNLSGGAITLVQGTTWDVMQNVAADASGTVTFDFTGNPKFDRAMSGVQLVMVPEPSSMLLVSLSGMTLLLRRRRH